MSIAQSKEKLRCVVIEVRTSNSSFIYSKRWIYNHIKTKKKYKIVFLKLIFFGESHVQLYMR